MTKCKEMEEFDFVDGLPDEYSCTICLCLLSNPHLTTCCGHHFCKDCIFKVAQTNKPCPMCKTEGFVAVVDKSLERKIRSLCVRCTFHRNGCSWKGELRELVEHLDPARRQCQYNEITCSKGCGRRVLVCDLDSHLRNECPNRDQECHFCNESVIFSNLTKHQENECPKVPVSCPNGCADRVVRGVLEKHLETCTMRLVKCVFYKFGCDGEVKWCSMAKHMDEWSQLHLCMLATCCSTLQDNLAKRDSQLNHLSAQLVQKEQDISKLKEELSLQKNDFHKLLVQQKKDLQEEITTLKSRNVVEKHAKLGEIQHRLMILETQVPVPPYYFTVSNFSLYKQGGTHWTSPPFFSRIGGYKLAIEVSANGEGVGKGTHVSVYIRIMHGEYDDMLRWPLRASVTIQLISQSGNEAHYEMITPDYEWAQVTSGMVGVGWGWDKFIQHEELGYNSMRRIQYLKNDRLNFRVISVDEY